MRNRAAPTFSGSHIRTVRSLLAVYKTPDGIPPPHRTTLTLAVCPPSVYSVSLLVRDHTLTVPSFEDEASRGFVGFLQTISHKSSGNGFYLHMNRLPCETGDPSRMTLHRGSNCVACLWIPNAHMAIVTSRSELSFSRLPLDAKYPPSMTGECMRRRFRVQIPETSISISRACGKESTCR